MNDDVMNVTVLVNGTEYDLLEDDVDVELPTFDTTIFSS